MQVIDSLNIPKKPVATSPTLTERTITSELWALLMMARKEWIIFRRYPSWVISFFIWPFLLPLGTIFTARAFSGPDNTSLPAFAARAGTTDYISFIVVGLTVYTWLNFILWDIGFHLRMEQIRGTLESTWLCPTWRPSILLGPSLTKLGTSLLILIMAVIEYRLIFGVQIVRGNWLLIISILALTLPSIYGLGIIFGSLVIRFREASTLFFLVRGLFMIFIGVSYPLAVLPAWMNQVASVIPLTYAIKSIRAVALSNATFAQVLPDIQMLAIFAIILPVTGYALFRFIERRSRQTGVLGQY